MARCGTDDTGSRGDLEVSQAGVFRTFASQIAVVITFDGNPHLMTQSLEIVRVEAHEVARL
jgi:hypothetical protein